ncbi:Protein of unknown function, partial [Gryllus bimaculatus]
MSKNAITSSHTVHDIVVNQTIPHIEQETFKNEVTFVEMRLLFPPGSIISAIHAANLPLTLEPNFSRGSIHILTMHPQFADAKQQAIHLMHLPSTDPLGVFIVVYLSEGVSQKVLREVTKEYFLKLGTTHVIQLLPIVKTNVVFGVSHKGSFILQSVEDFCEDQSDDHLVVRRAKRVPFGLVLILPFHWQTWSSVLCIVVLTVVAWALARWRPFQISSMLTAVFDVVEMSLT